MKQQTLCEGNQSGIKLVLIGRRYNYTEIQSTF